jgi:hypothetical protein
MKAGEDLARTAVTEGVRAALTSAGIPRLAAGLGRSRRCGHAHETGAGPALEDVCRAVQLLAVSVCPNVADHPAVEQYCLQPLASEVLSDAIQEELATLSGDG